MEMIAAFPGEYRQGRGVRKDLAQLVKRYGERALVIGHTHGLRALADTIVPAEGWHVETFSGECSEPELERLCRVVAEGGYDVVVGVGGGKSLDIARGVGHLSRTRLVMVPTAAVNDAPTSRTVGVYREEDHVFVRGLTADRNPDLVLADTEVMIKAPVRLLVAGMGDTLSKKIEVEACWRARAKTKLGGPSARFAGHLAVLAYEMIEAYGEQAIAAARKGAITEAFEAVVEANLLYSGISFENGGLSAAHAVGNGLSVLPEAQKALHGEKVAFGTIVQMVLEGRPEGEIRAILELYTRLGLPRTLTEVLGVPSIDRASVEAIAAKATVPGSIMENMPGRVTAAMVAEAIIGAEALGERMKRS